MDAWRKAKKMLYDNAANFTPQQYRTFRGQINACPEGALKGMTKILFWKEEEKHGRMRCGTYSSDYPKEG